MSVLVIGNHYWGHGEDLKEAKRNFQREGGKLSLGYNIVEFADGVKFDGVNQLGQVFWKDEKWCEDGVRELREPKVTEVKPRGTRK